MPSPLPRAQPVHLAVAVHGLWGDPENLDYLCDTLAQEHGGLLAPEPEPARTQPPAAGTASTATPTPGSPILPPDPRKKPLLVVLNSRVNRWVNTYDGVDWCAERVLREIREEIGRIHSWATTDVPASRAGGADREGAQRGQGQGQEQGQEQDQEQEQEQEREHHGGQSKSDHPVRNNAEVKRQNPTLEKGVRHTVTHFSIIGYSLGGLIARYVIGALYAQGFFGEPRVKNGRYNTPQRTAQDGEDPHGSPETQGAHTAIPMNFITLATPHLGIPQTNGIWGSILPSLGKFALGRTGKQLYCSDHEWYLPSVDESPPTSTTACGVHGASSQEPNESSALLPNSVSQGDDAPTGRPLLEAMADPSTAFMKAMYAFRTKVLYGSAKHDKTVPYRTALIDLDDPFAGDVEKNVKMTFVDGYPHLIDTYAVLSQVTGQAPIQTNENASPWSRLHTQMLAVAAIASSRSQSIAKAVWTPVMIFRPSRFPFNFPLNYVASVLAPLVLPMLVGYLLLQTTFYHRESMNRIAHERKAWAATNRFKGGHSSPPSTDAHSASSPQESRGLCSEEIPADPLEALDHFDEEQLERSRIAQMLVGVGSALEKGWNERDLSAMKEDVVSAGDVTAAAGINSAITPHHEHSADTYAKFSTCRLDWPGMSQESSAGDDRAGEPPGHTSPSSSNLRGKTSPVLPNVPPLSDAQQRMAKHLNAVPGLQKRIAYFGSAVFNTHSVIIVRRPQVHVNQLGVDVVRHLAALDKFLLASPTTPV